MELVRPVGRSTVYKELTRTYEATRLTNNYFGTALVTYFVSKDGEEGKWGLLVPVVGVLGNLLFAFTPITFH